MPKKMAKLADKSNGSAVKPISRALVSVYDKTGLDELAVKLHEHGVEIVSTGSTAIAIAEAGVPVTSVASVTGFPEILNGRVKTLHPHIHAGLLADLSNVDHVRQLREFEIAPFDLVVGTSIGALMGALIVHDKFDEGVELWKNITVDQVISQGVNLDFDLQLLMSQRERLVPLLQSYIKEKGMDVSPLAALVKKLVDPVKFVASKIPLYVITVEVPSFKPVVVDLKQTKPQEMADYILASASCFPAFPLKEVAGKKYIDGGYYDRLPINTAIDLGAQEIIAVNLKAPGMTRKIKDKDIPLKWIECYWSLGGFFNFTAEQAQRNITLGYIDAQKIYGKLFGYAYGFKGNRHHLNKLSKKLTASLAKINAKKSNKLVKELTLTLNKNDQKLLEHFSSSLSDQDIALRLLEKLLELFEYEPIKTYKLKKVLKEIKIKLQSAERIEIKGWFAEFVKDPKQTFANYELKNFLVSIAYHLPEIDSDVICLFFRFFPSECLLGVFIHCLIAK